MSRRKFLALVASAVGALALPFAPRQRFHAGGVVQVHAKYLVGEGGYEVFIPRYVLTANDLNRHIRDQLER